MGRRVMAALVGALAAIAVTAPAASALPPIKHVFVVVLENKGYDATFGPSSAAPYLSRTLTSQGQLLSDYYGIGHVSLDNYIAMVSGQAPNAQTQSDCQIFSEFAQAGTAADGQAIGQGCVYPAGVKTVADQLSAKGLTWKGYMEDMGADPARDSGTTCAHPALNSRDQTQSAAANDQYASRHNPFVYFHSIIDTPACAANDVPLDRLPAALADPAATASYSFITPNLCHDGHDSPCADGEPGGLVSADGFLRTWAPRILASRAYADGGMLVITFDEAEPSDTTACCGEQTGPNTPSPGGQNGGPGGGRIGAVVLSRSVEPGTVNATPYNHYSLLRTVEDAFGLDHLGYAGRAGLRPFGDDVFSATPAAAGSGTSTISPSGTGTAGSGSCTQPLGNVRATRGRLERGTLIAAVRLERRRGHRPRLVVRTRHAGRLYVSARGKSGRLHRAHAPASVFACRTYRITLPAQHGAARVAVSLKRGTERWAVRF